MEDAAKQAGLRTDRPTAADAGAAPPVRPAATSGRSARSPKAGSASGERAALEIPGYKLDKVIGKGATGIVYRAHQLSLGREVAVKLLRHRASEHPRFVERFLTEAKAVARLNHQNVVTAIDAGQVGERVYFVMELVDGETAHARLEREGPLGPDAVIPILLGVARALEHAASHGLVHRDVKPDNIMLAADGRVLLCDLGLARPEAREGEESERAALAEGTPYYMAPEQARGLADLDIRADLYALGATAYHLLTGEVPFDGADARAIMKKHVVEPFPDVRAALPELPEELAALITRLVEKDRAQRPAHPREVVTALERLLRRRGRAPSASAAVGGARQAPPALALAAVGVAAVLALGGALYWWTRDRGAPAADVAAATDEPAAERGAGRRGRAAPGDGSVAADGEGGGAAPPASTSGRAAEAALKLGLILDGVRSGVIARGVALDDLRALADAYAGTDPAAEAAREADRLEAIEAATVEGRLAEIAPLVEDRVRAGQFASARGLLDQVLTEARGGAGASQVVAAIAELDRRCAAAWTAVAAEARAAGAAGRAGEGARLCRDFAARATPALAAQASALTAELERAQAGVEAVAGADTPAGGALLELALGASTALLRQGDFAGARARLAALAPEGLGDGERARREAALGQLDRVLAAESALTAALRALEARSELGLLNGLSISGTGRGFEVDERGVLLFELPKTTRPLRLRLAHLEPALAAELATGGAAATPEAREAAGLCLLYRGAPAAAARALGAEASPPASLPAFVKEDLEKGRLLIPEAKAEVGLLVAERLVEADRRKEALAALEPLFGPLKGTALVKARTRDVVSAYGAARAPEIASGPLQGFFAGKVSGSAKKATITYGFADASELADWTAADPSDVRAVDGAFRFRGRVAWRGRVEGALTLDATFPVGNRARGGGFAIYENGAYTGWFCGLRVEGEDRVLRLSGACSHPTQKEGTTFKLPAHVITKLGGSVMNSEWACFSKGPGLAPNVPVSLAIATRSRQLGFRFADFEFPTVRLGADDMRGGIAVITTGDRQLDVSALKLSCTIDDAWLAAEAVRKAESEAAARLE